MIPLTAQFKLILEKSCDESVVANLAQKIWQTLLIEKSFCVWLIGDVGAGKTHLIRAILRAAGLSDKIPVTSPTFAHVYEYKINHQFYLHADLFRDAVSQEEISFPDQTLYKGSFIEWPTDNSGFPFEPTHKIEIDFLNDGESRRYRFYQSRSF